MDQAGPAKGRGNRPNEGGPAQGRGTPSHAGGPPKGRKFQSNGGGPGQGQGQGRGPSHSNNAGPARGRNVPSNGGGPGKGKGRGNFPANDVGPARSPNFFTNNAGPPQGRGGYAQAPGPARGKGRSNRSNDRGPAPGPSRPPHEAGPLRGRTDRPHQIGAALHDVPHIASIDTLAQAAILIATRVEREVWRDRKRADRLLGALLRPRRDLAPPDHRFISQCAFALLRWGGWLEPLGLVQPEERLLYAWLLDSPTVHPACRVWARNLRRDPARLVALGDAPNWTTRSEGFKRLLDGRAVTADPWRLFPPWLRENLPLPPGGGSPKTRFVEFLLALQKRPSLWVRVQGADESAIWSELTASGIKPWIHRRLTVSAKLDADSDVHHLPAFTRGQLEIQDLASQAVGLVCDPDPGERWWDACAGAGGKSLHLASLMKGKGLVVATDVNAARLKEAIRRARRSPFRNLTTKAWDGRYVPGKAKSFDGVLVDAPCSAIGTWRRNPDARWSIDRQAITRLAETQAHLLHIASGGVRPGGTLVYSVCTVTPAETTEVVRNFLQSHPQFKLDPFPHPLMETTTNGMTLIWPQDADTDAMFIARMILTT
ncbi:hypothetical protein [Singulisphaera sp. GP187]|uniref:hypothetical protein n=1 Tax=Singulisphaera sp. GP187 TaxID=1882752 RepID=UPI0013563E32|nr:hypothetical protein [Singulisphaera sp. GP187]